MPVFSFSENFDTMTVPECLAFIKRSRRQIDHLLLPNSPSEQNHAKLVAIRARLDRLEADVLASSAKHP